MLSANSSNLSSSNVLRGLVEDSTSSARGTFTYSGNDCTASFVIISFSPFSEFSKGLILFRQKNRGDGAVGFGDDVELHVGKGSIAAQEPESPFQAELVFSAVLFAQVAPIAVNVTREEVQRSLACFFESGQCARSG